MDTSLTLPRFQTAEIGESTFVVSATGLVDDDAAVDLGHALFPVVCAADTLVILDLVSAPLVGRAALGLIASAAHLARRNGRDLVVVTRDPAFTQAFRDCSLHEIARLERTIADGVANAN